MALNQTCRTNGRNDRKTRTGRTIIGKLIVNMPMSFRNNFYNRTEESKELLLKASIQIPQDPGDCYPVHLSTSLANTTKHSYFESQVLVKNIVEISQSLLSF